MKIELINIDQISPYWRNPRDNSETAELLCKVIEKYGFNVPLVLDKSLVVVKGHARLRAARKLGMDKVPCIISNASDDANRADRIYDNKIAELSKWDYVRLEAGLESLGKFEFKSLFETPEPIEIETEHLEVTETGEIVGIPKEALEAEQELLDEAREKKKSVRVVCPCCGDKIDVPLS